MKRTCITTALAVSFFFFNIAAPAQEATTHQNQIAPPPATVTGSGTANYIPLWTGSSTLGNSTLFQTGGKIGVGTTTPGVALDVSGRINTSKSYQILGLDFLSEPPGSSIDNLAVGFSALKSSTTGQQNTAVGMNALENDTSGQQNTACGAYALESVTTASGNTGTGAFALVYNTGNDNTATGTLAMNANKTGVANVAMGFQAMLYSDHGNANVALGMDSLFNDQAGSDNTAVGFESLYNNEGNGNIGIGYQAGLNVYQNNSNNIHIGSLGVSADNNTIRIGTVGTQTSFFAAGVSGVTTGLNDAVPVVVDTNGQLGTVSSSRRFKEDIHDMGAASEGLMRLRPVTFRYIKPFADGSKPVQYGLIAEEVAKVNPNLVAHSADGQIETVKYQALDSMLLNEIQRQQAEIQREKDARQHEQAEIKSLQERLARMEAALASISQTK